MENNQYGLTEQETKAYSMLSKIIIIFGTLSWLFIPYQFIVKNEPEWLFYSMVSMFTAWTMLLALGASQGTKILALEYATLGRYKLNFKDYLVAVVLVLTSIMLLICNITYMLQLSLCVVSLITIINLLLIK